MDNIGNGPKGLDRLYGAMTGFVAQKKAGATFSQGKAQNIPDKYCPVCAAVFGSAPPEAPFKPKLCGLCIDKLKDGDTAFVCGNRYAFIRNSKSLADMAGRIVKIKPEEMDALAINYRQAVKTKSEPERKAPSDAN